MEKKYKKVSSNKAGGTASANALAWKVGIPNRWIADMEITKEDRDIEISYDENHKIITIKKVKKA